MYSMCVWKPNKIQHHQAQDVHWGYIILIFPDHGGELEM